MLPRIAFMHYASPPGVGGVESTIAYQARGLADIGYLVRVISGAGGTFDPRIETIVDPLFGSRDARILAAKADLDRGVVTPAFEMLVNDIEARLNAALDGCAVCIVHNIHTMNKNLALTTALARLTQPRLIAWVHDLAWTNPQYQAELSAGKPYDLMRTAWSNTRYVTISAPRQAETADLLGIPADQIPVVPPGVDIPLFFQWTEMMRDIVARLNLLDADLILLLPARLTRRKNIALAIRVLAEVRRISGQDCRLIVTGPPGPHNPANPGYLSELLDLRRELGLQDAAHFLYELHVPDDTTMANLYQLADALLFPSVQEGFGIPILEAGIAGIPIFCSDLPVFRESGQSDLIVFDPEHDSPGAIAAQIDGYFHENARHRLKTRVRHHYRWEVIIRRQLVPLLEIP